MSLARPPACQQDGDMGGVCLRSFIRSAAIAIAAGLLGDYTYDIALSLWVTAGNRWREPVSHVVLFAWIGGIAALALGVDAWLRRRERPQVEQVPHCHKCGYITIGLSQPVCPECGSKVEDI